jgi:hypothetical protein
MSEAFTPDELGTTPTVEVIVYRDGAVVHRELCATDADASAVADQWNELGAIECQIEDLSVRHGPTDVLEPTEGELSDDAEPRRPT